MRGRKPKPTHLRAIDGDAVPSGDDEAPPVGLRADIPACPDHLDGVAREEWERITEELLEAGLIAKIYRGPLAAYCQAYGRWVEAELALRSSSLLVLTPNQYPMQSPFLSIANKAMEQMRIFATEFGMTPSSLARASRVDQLNLFGDEFENFLSGRPATA